MKLTLTFWSVIVRYCVFISTWIRPDGRQFAVSGCLHNTQSIKHAHWTRTHIGHVCLLTNKDQRDTDMTHIIGKKSCILQFDQFATSGDRWLRCPPQQRIVPSATVVLRGTLLPRRSPHISTQSVNVPLLCQALARTDLGWQFVSEHMPDGNKVKLIHVGAGCARRPFVKVWASLFVSLNFPQLCDIVRVYLQSAGRSRLPCCHCASFF